MVQLAVWECCVTIVCVARRSGGRYLSFPAQNRQTIIDYRHHLSTPINTPTPTTNPSTDLQPHHHSRVFYTTQDMASPDLQSKVNQLTSKIQGELTTVIDELERYKLRPIAVSASSSDQE